MTPVHQHPTGFVDSFELEYALQLEADAARMRRVSCTHTLRKMRPRPYKEYICMGRCLRVGYGPAQQQYGYQYPAGGAGGGYGPGYGAEGEAQKRKKKEGKGGVETFKQKGTSGVTKDRPYTMILLGAGLAAVASLFRMFRLSLFILVGWMVFYGKDLWLIIAELQ